jgi:hypothetical protein
MGLYARCCSILENHLWQQKQTSFSIVMYNVNCRWEVAEAEGVLGNMSLGAPRQAGRQAGRQARNFKILTVGEKIST